MTSRGYLSIGDVLTLLRQEFPDVTISKIRFLESQGLVNPERSPSGYRKFYDRDVGRLRWVLLQQREHFLPLKVIRDRLNREGDGVLAEVGPPQSSDDEEARPPAASSARAPALSSARAKSPAPTGAPPPPHNGFEGPEAGTDSAEAEDAVATVRALRPAPVMVAAGAPTPEAKGPGPPSPGPADEEPPPDATRRAARPETLRGASATGGRGIGGGSAGPPEPQGPEAKRPRSEGPGRHPTAEDRRRSAGRVAASRERGAAAGMTAEELCRASGLSHEALEALERFGLLEPLSVAGIPHYDDEALTVARLSAKLASYGVEPRHLRLFRNAVDREVGLIEQIVTPLLRQRNPEARQKAVEAAREVAEVGDGIRSALVRQELRRHFGA